MTEETTSLPWLIRDADTHNKKTENAYAAFVDYQGHWGSVNVSIG
jgi:hypothetical protein